MKRFFIILFFISTISVFGQNEKQKVLVCFFNNINFDTKYPSIKIAQINSIQTNQIVDSLQYIFMKGLQAATNDSIEFVPLKDFESNYFFKKAEINFKKEPSHYHRNLDNVPYNEFQFLLKKYDASSILFINRYLIVKSKKSEEEQNAFIREAAKLNLSIYLDSKRISYSRHYVDFDLYNFEMEEISSFGDYILPFPRLDANNYQLYGLDFYTLENSYRLFGEQLIEENFYIE